MKSSKKSKSTIPRKESANLFGESSNSIPNTHPAQSAGFFFGGSSSSNTQPAGFSFGASSTPWDPRVRFINNILKKSFDLFKQGRITHFPDMKEFIHYIQNLYYFYPDIISKDEIGKLYWMFKLTHLSEIEKIYSIARSDSPDGMYQDWNEWPESWHRGNRLEGLD